MPAQPSVFGLVTLARAPTEGSAAPREYRDRWPNKAKLRRLVGAAWDAKWP
jgi:hypothetical protein